MDIKFFRDYFDKIKYTDEFGYNQIWNKEINRWLELICNVDHDFYNSGKKRIKQSNAKRDEFLGEIFAVFYFHKILKANKLKLEPNGLRNKKLDFACSCFGGQMWFVEVKSPSWKGEVQKNTGLNQKEKNKRCEEPQYKNDGGGSFTPRDAIEDSIKNSLAKFDENKNNALVIVPNMFVPICENSIDLENIIRDEILKQDDNKLLSKVIILEKSLIYKKIEYQYYCLDLNF